LRDSLGHYDTMNADLDRMRAIPCAQRRGYSYLGVLVGEGLMTPTQANVAFEDWRNPRYPDFEDRTAWSLYNCVTEGLKKGGPAGRFQRQIEAHKFFTTEVR
jgi:hypothetical protein